MEEPPILPAAPLAYENSDFLNSPDGRVLRILSEYSEPLARFRREKIQDTVVFFGSARFASLSDAVEPDAAVQEAPLRRHLGRRTRHHGSRQPRRPRSRRQDDRTQYPLALRAVSEPLHHTRAEFRISLLLHAQVLVRVFGQGTGDLPRWLRHAGRAFRDPYAGADPEAGEKSSDHDLRRQGVLAKGPEHRGAGRVRCGLA